MRLPHAMIIIFILLVFALAFFAYAVKYDDWENTVRSDCNQTCHDNEYFYKGITRTAKCVCGRYTGFFLEYVELEREGG